MSLQRDTKNYYFIIRGDHSEKRFSSRKQAEEVLDRVKGNHGVVSKIDKKQVTKEAPNLYSLSSLQMEANSCFGYTLKQTLDIVQYLYDNGYTTYPRTNSQYLTDDMEPTVNKVLDALSTMPEYSHLIIGKNRKFNRNKYFDSKKVESHYAIIPTGNIPESLNDAQKKIFDLIARSVIKMLYGPAVIEKMTVTTTVKTENFISQGSCITEPGWMVCGGATEEVLLPELYLNEAVNGQYSLKEKETEPPKRYTEKTLLAAMLSAGKDIEDDALRKIMSDLQVKGIGTEATRAAIIETLLNRGYIERKGKSIIATEKGIALIDALPVSEMKSAELTAQWEARLDDIAKGKEHKETFQSGIEELTKKWCKELQTVKFTSVSAAVSAEPEISCPICKAPMRNAKYSWMCTNNECKFSLNHVICGKKLSAAQEKKILTTGASSQISGFKSKSGKDFKAKLKVDIDSKKVVFEF